jgi:hypothetical protein
LEKKNNNKQKIYMLLIIQMVLNTQCQERG